MKNCQPILLVAFCMFAMNVVFAQAPLKINYQAVARNSSGLIITNQSISLLFRIRTGSSSGTQQYKEIDTVTTNKYGLFSVQIGNGILDSGSMSGITWGSGDKFLEVAMDPKGGFSFTFMGTQQLVSVPYALYAATSGSGGSGVSGWSLTGNGGTKADTNFIGTTDSTSLVFKVNKKPAGLIDVNNYSGNTSFGYLSLNSNTTGYSNTAFGYWSLANNTTGVNNSSFGQLALFSNTIGNSNTANGYGALHSNTSGGANTAFGSGALESNTLGNANTAIGRDALWPNKTGSSNTAVGTESLSWMKSGSNNTALGVSADAQDSSGNENVAVGYSSLSANWGPRGLRSYNTAVGSQAFYFLDTGSYNTAIGYKADIVSGLGGSHNISNATAIGYNATAWSNTIRLGNTSISAIQCATTTITTSDKRIKNNIQSNVAGLSFIKLLKPVTYNVSVDKQNEILAVKNNDNWPGKYDIEKIRFSGFLAQDVEQAANQAGYDFSGVYKPANSKDMYGLRYAEFVVPLVKAVQEQQAIIENQNQQIATQQQTIDTITKQLAELSKQVNTLNKAVNK